MGIELKSFTFESLLRLLKLDTTRKKDSPGYAFVASTLGNSVSSLLLQDDRWVVSDARMPLQAPTSVVRSPCGPFIYAASAPTNTISAFKVDSGGDLTRLNSLSVSVEPEAMAVCSTGKFLYVSGGQSRSLSVVRLERNGTLSAPLVHQTQAEVHDLACHPEEPLLCLCNKRAGTLTFVSLSYSGEIKEVGSVDAGTEPAVARWSRDGQTLFVLNAGLGISVWKRSEGLEWKRVAFFPTGRGTSHFTLGPQANRLYVARFAEDEVSAYDLEGVRLECRQTIPCPGGPSMLAMSRCGTQLLAACVFEQLVSSYRVGEEGLLKAPSTVRIHSLPVAIV